MISTSSAVVLASVVFLVVTELGKIFRISHLPQGIFRYSGWKHFLRANLPFSVIYTGGCLMIYLAYSITYEAYIGSESRVFFLLLLAYLVTSFIFPFLMIADYGNIHKGILTWSLIAHMAYIVVLFSSPQILRSLPSSPNGMEAVWGLAYLLFLIFAVFLGPIVILSVFYYDCRIRAINRGATG